MLPKADCGIVEGPTRLFNESTEEQLSLLGCDSEPCDELKAFDSLACCYRRSLFHSYLCL